MPSPRRGAPQMRSRAARGSPPGGRDGLISWAQMNLVADDFSECMDSGFMIRQSYTNQFIYLCLYRYVACVSRSLHHCEPSLGHDGSKLIVGHINGPLELGGVSGAEGGWAAITTVQDSP